MKKASGFKMKNPSVAKLAKAAGSPMRKDKVTYEEAWDNMQSYESKKGHGKFKDNWERGGTVYTDDEYGKAEFIKDAKAYNVKKYGTTEPTKASKEAGVSKESLAEGKKKVDAGTGSKLVKTDFSKKTIKGTDAKKPVSTPPSKIEKSNKKKFKNTKAGKFLSKVVGTGAKRKANEANKKKKQNRSVTGRMKAKASKFGRMGT